MLNINPWDILWTVINLLVLFLLLKRFLFKPVIAMMDRRAAMIQDDIDRAKAAKEEAEQLKTKYEGELKDAQQQAADITAKARKRAEADYNKIIESARTDAVAMITDAEKTIRQEQEKAVSAAKEKIADLAVLAAAQVISKNIDKESNLVYAEQILSEVGASNE